MTTDLAVGERGDARALVVHADRESEVTAPPGTSLVVFGAAPDGSEATHWESEVWSENPAAPPAPTEPTDPVFVYDGESAGERADGDWPVSHQTALAAADDICVEFDVDGDTAVVVETDFSDVRTLVAGVLAPLVAGGQTRLAASGETTEPGDSIDGDDEPLVVGDTIPLARVDLDQ
ncbi:MAG: hypothetical protein ABEI99_05530 [Halobaculum sp.]